VSASSWLSLRPLKWVGGGKKSLDGLPEDVKDVFGSALLDVQYGGTPDGVKPFGEGLPHEIWKNREPVLDQSRERRVSK
jgi:phage-related protein